MDSWEDFFDTPHSITHYQAQEEQYQFVDQSLRKYRKPPVHFSIAIKCIDGDTHKATCYPGSTIEGVVKIKLDTPLAAHHLKLVFKGSGKIIMMNVQISDFFYRDYL
jgi:hypothetical protein